MDYDPVDDLSSAEQAAFSRLGERTQAKYLATKRRVWAKIREPGIAGNYGACPRGGDPREYYPDLECSTPAEVSRWAEARDLWDQGDKHPEGPYVGSDLCSRDESFGIGVYWFVAPPGWFDEDNDDLTPDGPHLPQRAYVEPWPVKESA